MCPRPVVVIGLSFAHRPDGCRPAFSLQNEELDKKYAGLLEKKWTSVIRLQKKVCETPPL